MKLVLRWRSCRNSWISCWHHLSRWKRCWFHSTTSTNNIAAKTTTNTASVYITAAATISYNERDNRITYQLSRESTISSQCSLNIHWWFSQGRWWAIHTLQRRCTRTANVISAAQKQVANTVVHQNTTTAQGNRGNACCWMLSGQLVYSTSFQPNKVEIWAIFHVQC